MLELRVKYIKRVDYDERSECVKHMENKQRMQERHTKSRDAIPTNSEKER